jgi:hypothetical protein
MRYQQTWQSWLTIATLNLCALSAHPVQAAEFSKTGAPENGPDIIFVAGDLALGDEKKFINAALSSGNAVVVLQSPGGSLIAGIEIGKAIHLKGFATYVPDNIQCASACALAWLGGRVRYMSNTARVGFHAVYVDNGGQAAVSSSGNALVGAYLNQIGLPPPAIVYITEASPQGMQWLTFTDAQRYGIDVRPFDLSSAPTIAQTGASGTSSSPQVTSIDKELHELIGATNRSNDFALAYLESKYADQVNYYGKVLSRVSVLNDKRSFFTGWPSRSYSIQPATIAVTCESISVCKAQGVLEWNHAGRSMTSLGSATFSFQWVLEGNHWQISSEDGKVIRRKVAPLAVTSETTPRTTSGLPSYQLDRLGTKVISLSGLTTVHDCVSDGVYSTGKVIQRKFDSDGLVLNGFIVEAPSGSREFVNVEVDFDKMDNATKAWIMNGLQTLLAEGRSVEFNVAACGAAGRVEILNAVRQPSSSGG